MSDINLSTFPSNRIEALTMLYLQNQDFSDITPEKLLEKYLETYERIREHYRKIH